MRVLVITQYFWPESFIINDLVELLHDRGLGVTVLTGKPNYPGGKIFDGYQASGIKLDRVGQVPIVRLPIFPRRDGSSLALIMNYLSFIISGVLYGPKTLKDVKYDVIFVYGISPILQAIVGIWLAYWRKVPMIVWVQDLWPETLSATGYIKQPLIISFVACIVRKIYGASDRILVQSRAFIPEVAALTDNVDKIHYYPNLYRPKVGGNNTNQSKLAADEIRANFSIVFAGNLGIAQSLDTIIDAAELLKSRDNIKFYFLGSGSMEGWLAQQITLRKLQNVHLMGRFEATDMQLLFEAASALLVSLKPNKVFNMTVPAKVSAYLSAGRPILACLDGEGARIVMEAQAGYCSPAGNAELLAKSIIRMKTAPLEVRKTMGEKGHKYFQSNYSSDLLVNKLIDQFEQTIKNGVR